MEKYKKNFKGFLKKCINQNFFKIVFLSLIRAEPLHFGSNQNLLKNVVCKKQFSFEELFPINA